jgi:hypothetical protein
MIVMLTGVTGFESLNTWMEVLPYQRATNYLGIWRSLWLSQIPA